MIKINKLIIMIGLLRKHCTSYEITVMHFVIESVKNNTLAFHFQNKHTIFFPTVRPCE